MSDWTSGYVADIGYTYGYYGELNPAKMQLAFASAGLVAPEVGVACELGFGQGLSTAMHAAAAPVRWHGTDFNPAQAGFAQQMAAVSESGAQMVDQPFDQFCSRTDLPEFDFIGLHGIWSWISDDNRRMIVDFIARKLKVGGVLYISYNTEAGWTSMVPMRRLMHEHSMRMSAPATNIIGKVDAALGFAEKLMAAKPLFAAGNPLLTERMRLMKDQNRSYLAHEYFNRDWHPMAFTQVADWLEPAKLDFACSTHLVDHVAAINLSEDQQAVLNAIPDGTFRESVRDFIVNQPFRRDYWVKGARKLGGIEQLEILRKMRVVLQTARADIALTVRGSMGDAQMAEGVYNPLLDLLADYKPRSLTQIESALAPQGINIAQLSQAVVILAGKGSLAVAQDDKLAAKMRASCEKLNTFLIARARSNGDVTFLVSPVTGGGIAISRIWQLFLLARLQGKKLPGEMADVAWAVLHLEGRKLVKAGATIEGVNENIAELVEQATDFMAKQAPMLKALGIIG